MRRDLVEVIANQFETTRFTSAMFLVKFEDEHFQIPQVHTGWPQQTHS